MKLIASLLLGAFAVAGCSDAGDRAAKPPASPRTVAYLLAHPDEHDAVKRQCRNDPGALRNTLDCVNADQAEKQISVWSFDEAVRRSKEGL